MMRFNLLPYLLGICITAPTPALAGQVPSAPGDEKVVRSLHKSIPWIPDLTTPLDGRPVLIGAVHFDGTRNDASRVPVGERKTIVAHLAENVRSEDLLFNYYLPGAGTTGGSLTRAKDSAFGQSVKITAEDISKKVIKDVRVARQSNPDADIRIFVTGFSRGGAAARHFMNTTQRVWRAEEGSNQEPRFYALIFDTVATGQQDTLTLRVPESADLFVHFISTDERRFAFTPTLDIPDPSTPGRILQLELPGVHSDVGSSYATGIGSEYVGRVEALVSMMGIAPSGPRIVQGDAFSEGKHDSRWIFEKAAMIGAPNTSRNVQNRNKILVESEKLTESSATLWRERMLKMSSERSFDVTSKAISVQSFLISKNAEGLSVRPVHSTAQPSVDIRQEGGDNIIAYSYDGIFISRVLISKKVLDRIEQGKTIQADLRLHTATGVNRLWWFMDNEILDEAQFR